MVTPNEVDTSSESASSPEATEALPVSGDQPLIPANFVEGIGVVEPGTETAAVADTGDEATSDESTTDETPETTESTDETPAAETTEAPESASTETEATDGESAEPRTYTQEERNNQEATYQRQFAEQEKRYGELEKQVSEIRNQSQDAILNAQANGYITALTQRYQDDGMDESKASDRATNEVNAGLADWQTKQENGRLREQVTQANANAESTARGAGVENLMTKYSVPESQRELLAGYTDARLADSAAKALGAAEGERKTRIKAKQAEVPAGGPSNSFDGGSGASGGQSEKDWIETQWNTGKARGPEALDRAVRYQASQGA